MSAQRKMGASAIFATGGLLVFMPFLGIGALRVAY